jgi:integrase/recombinase XerC
VAEPSDTAPEVDRIEHTHIRAYLGTLYERGLSKGLGGAGAGGHPQLVQVAGAQPGTSSRTRLAGGHAALPKHLPRVPSIEQMNRVVDSVGDDAASWPARDRAILEMLYGCGIRNAELTGLNLDDIHWANEAILVRGKGQKQRYVPLGDAAAAGAARVSYPSARRGWPRPAKKRVETPALFLNLQLRGLGKAARRGSPRAAWAASSSASPSCAASLPTCIRTRCATPSARICWKKAPTCAPFRSCSATSASRPRSATRS